MTFPTYMLAINAHSNGAWAVNNDGPGWMPYCSKAVSMIAAVA